MKKQFLTVALAAIAISVPVTAAAGDNVSLTVTTDYVSDYVFRGFSLADSAIQPGVELGLGDFYAGAWVSTGIGDTSFAALDELDVYAGYGFSLSDTVSADLGVTYYHYPDLPGSFLSEDNGTYEVYAGLSLDSLLSPSAYIYYDFTLEALTLEGSVGHSVPLGDKTSIDLGLTAGLVTFDGPGDWEWGQASANVSYAFTDDVSVYGGVNYVINSQDYLDFSSAGKGDLLFIGTGVSAGF